MPRLRVNYASQALYCGTSPSTGAHFLSGQATGALGVLLLSGNLVNQLYRVQSCNERYTVNLTNVNQLGELAALDRVIITSPQAGLDFTYILADFSNERAMGFVTDGSCSCISGMLNGTRDDRNYFLRIGLDGVDEINDTTTTSTVMGIGNGFLSSYNVTAAVGRFPEASVKIDALNALIQSSYSGASPAIIPTNGLPVTGVNGTGFQYSLPTAAESAGTAGIPVISALRPGDITFTLNNSGTLTPYSLAGPSITDAKIQSFNLGVNLTREEIGQLGSYFTIGRPIKFPLEATLSIDAVLGDLTTGNLANIISCNPSYDITVNINTPTDCIGTAKSTVCSYILKGAKFQSQDYTSSLTANTTVKLNFSSQIGGPNQQNIGLFMSGVGKVPAVGF